MILPQLRTALRMRHELASLQGQVSDLQAVLQTRAVGIVLVDSQGKSVFANRAAEMILSVGDGLRLRGGRFTVDCASELARLQALIGSAIQTAWGRSITGGGSCLISRRYGVPLRLSVQPLPLDSALSEAGRARRAAVVIVLRAADTQPPPPAALLRDYYGLSPAEARLALQLYEGHSLTSTAQMNDVAVGTARAQLKAVFRKTGVGRQIDLQRLLQALNTE